MFALLALVLQKPVGKGGLASRTALILLGLFGGAFLYGDGIITPAISVLGAVEGLEVAAPGLSQEVIVILAALIIAVLFYFQDHGTAKVGGTFGWIMLVWFISIAALGIGGIVKHPEILLSFSPTYAIGFFAAHPLASFLVLGAVVLVVTGGEALYADMGHFGPRPIRVVWFGMVLPALLLNYLGQGALLLAEPTAVDNPFFRLVPPLFLYPMLVVATLAAIVASQALISGAFSLTHQAVQLGYTPRVTIVHTSKQEAGQIYIPEVNKALAIGTLLLVLGIRLLHRARRRVRRGGHRNDGDHHDPVLPPSRANASRGRPLQVGAFLAFFLTIDLALFTANLLKVATGGWVPLVIAVGVFTLMTTWKRGRAHLRRSSPSGRSRSRNSSKASSARRSVRVPGTAVFMTSESEGTPVVLLHHLKHNKVLHNQVILLSIIVQGGARGPGVGARRRRGPDERDLPGEGVLRVHAAA